MSLYKNLKQQKFHLGNYSLVPIRMEDRFSIMKWRNEQLYHLRQSTPLTLEDQNKYFNDVVSRLFEQEKPSQLLFSYLEGDKCIGYGGIVHINWIDKNAELSFIMDTIKERLEFFKHWSIYLRLIERVSFEQLKLHKIYTYAFDLRPHLYNVLEQNGFSREAILKEHCLFNGVFKNVVIHTKINLDLKLRRAEISDLRITFKWASDPLIRKFSLTNHLINFDEHTSWFSSKLNDNDCIYFIAEVSGKPIGSIRFDIRGNEAIVSYLLEPDMHGKGFGKQMLHLGVVSLFEETNVNTIKGLVLEDNVASVNIFNSLGFVKVNISNTQITYSKNRLV